MSQVVTNPNYDTLRNKLWDLTAKVASMEQELKTAESSARRREKLDKHIKDINQHSKILSTVKNKTVNLRIVVQKVYKEYRDKKMDVVSDYITDSVTKFYPNRMFRAVVDFKESRGELQPALKLYDSKGFERRMSITEGQFFQSLTNYAGSVSMLLELGLSKLYLDESFSVSDPNNMRIVSTLFEEVLDEINQMFMIEQTSIGYRNLPRREIHLEFDEVLEEVVNVVYKVYSKEDVIAEGGHLNGDEPESSIEQ